MLLFPELTSDWCCWEVGCAGVEVNRLPTEALFPECWIGEPSLEVDASMSGVVLAEFGVESCNQPLVRADLDNPLELRATPVEVLVQEGENDWVDGAASTAGFKR